MALLLTANGTLAQTDDLGVPGQGPVTRNLTDVLRVVIKSPCFDAESLVDVVDDWIGRDTVDGRITGIQVRASQGVLSFSIEVADQPPTTREFPELPHDCTEQTKAIGLSIGLAIEALEADFPAAAAEAPDASNVLVSVTGVLSTGIPTGLGLGAALNLEWRPAPWLGLRVGASGLTAGEQRLRDGMPFVYTPSLIVGSMGACITGDLVTSLALAGCGDVALGAFRTSSGGQFDKESTSQVWSHLSAAGELRWTLAGAFGVLLRAEALFPLRPITIDVRNENRVPVASRQFPVVIGAVHLGPTLAF